MKNTEGLKENTSTSKRQAIHSSPALPHMANTHHSHSQKHKEVQLQLKSSSERNMKWRAERMSVHL